MTYEQENGRELLDDVINLLENIQKDLMRITHRDGSAICVEDQIADNNRLEEIACILQRARYFKLK